MRALADDLVAPDAVRDPYSLLARLREESPVHWSERHHAWIVTRYADVEAGLADDRLSTDNIRALQAKLAPDDLERFAPAARLLASWMLFNDPPVHTRLRVPVRSAFTPRAVEGLRSRLAQVVDGLLDRMAAQRECDLVESLALPLPAIAIAELLGVPADRHDEFRASSRLLGALVVGKVDDPGAWAKAVRAAGDFAALFSDLIARYGKEPADNLITALIAARDEGNSLSADEMVGACTMLLFAGHETTTNLIASGVLALLRHPGERDRLAADPTLLGSAVEEIVRFDGPAKVVVRRVREGHVLDGHELAEDQPVFLAIAAANRDPAVFREPDRFDIGRSPNKHLGFGWGRHFCLGAQLARLEAAVVIERVVQRFAGLRLACDARDLRWQANVVGRALRRLPVTVS